MHLSEAWFFLMVPYLVAALPAQDIGDIVEHDGDCVDCAPPPTTIFLCADSNCGSFIDDSCTSDADCPNETFPRCCRFIFIF
ncbi:uncharacterized protein LY89DRAFT_681853 [Mollisia scopiformis]|uniref:Uncharacterized protein n=1 Tax=Mollisia scopiformis TaxID=149040 RepID=A0A194XME5_MOLSC|nr:uncharacterized protein LY89DRAFT_681853 [Mollisia scopiformis]KUJ21296.1 hypothetical protein LY89DRAFT_681853 [Mollisia scopiformis]